MNIIDHQSKFLGYPLETYYLGLDLEPFKVVTNYFISSTFETYFELSSTQHLHYFIVWLDLQIKTKS